MAHEAVIVTRPRGSGHAHGTAAADSDNPRGVAVQLADHVFFYLCGELVHIAGFGFIVHIDPNQKIVGMDGQAIFERSPFKDVVHQKNHNRFAVLPLLLKNISQLGEASPPEDDLGNHFKITKHVIFLLWMMWPLLPE